MINKKIYPDILRTNAKNLKFYSPLFGYVKLLNVDDMSIEVSNPIEGKDEPSSLHFFADGRFPGFSNGECALFPSRVCRTWKMLQFEQGDIVAIDTTFKQDHPETYVMIFRCVDYGGDVIGIVPFVTFSTSSKELNLYERFALDGSHFDEESISLRYATEKETAILMDALEKNGKKWDAGRHKVLPLYEEDISIRELQQNFNSLLHDFKLLEAAYKRKVEECEQFRIELSEVKTHVGQLDVTQAELPSEIKRFEQSEFVEIGLDCPFHYCVPPTDPANLIIKVGSNMCMACRHFMKGDVLEKRCVLCAARYDEKDLHQK